MKTTTTETLGTWKQTTTGATLTSRYHDESTVRIDADGTSRVLTEEEWLAMWDDLRDSGYRRMA